MGKRAVDDIIASPAWNVVGACVPGSGAANASPPYRYWASSLCIWASLGGLAPVPP